MNISRRSLLSLLLYVPSFRVYSGCYTVNHVFEDYYIESAGIKKVCIPCDYEGFLNKRYGINSWQYDENLFMKYPKLPDNGYRVPITTGANEDTLVEKFTEVTIYIEYEVRILDKLKKFQSVQDSWEKQIIEIADFKFSEDIHPFISTLVKTNIGDRVNIFSVFTNEKKGLIKVAKPPYLMKIYNGCDVLYYIKNNTE